MSPSLLFLQPIITNLVWNRCRSAQNNSVARCLFRHENTFDFAGGKGVKLEGGLSCCLEHFLEYTYFSRLVEVIFRMLQQEGILYAHASIRPLEEPQRHFL